MTPNPPAFPVDTGMTQHAGMSMRDYFAAKAMQSLVANFLGKDLDSIDPQGWMEGLAMDAYRQADAMMEARK
jgi:hypothetical protein